MAADISTTINFTNSANFTFDPVKVEFPGTVAQLLPENVSLSFNQSFATDTGFTYDNTKAEFTGGQVQQSDQTPTDSRIGANYDSSINADWSKDGATTGTANGTPTVVSGRLDCTGELTKGVYYAITNSGQGAIKVIYRPNYSGAPGQNINVFGIQESSGNNNRVLLTHSPSSDTWRVTVTDSSGTNVQLVTVIGATGVGLVANTDYELELNWDNVAGTIRLFQDGVLYGTLSPGAWTHGSSAARFYVGSMPTLYDVSDASLDQPLFFNAVQHTSGYTPGYTVPSNIYAASNVTLPEFTHTGVGTIVAYTSMATTETAAPRFTIKSGTGNFQYFNGSAWVDSDDTYAQANTQSDLSTNLPTNTAASGVTAATIKILFDDSNTQSAVDDLTLNYTGQVTYYTDDPPVTQATGLSVDGVGSLSAVTTASGSDSVTFIANVDGTDMYWTGAAWANSDGTLAQSNTAADVNTNISTLDLSAGVTFKWKIILHSDDGTTTPTITSLTFTYDFFVPKPGAINECLVYGWEDSLDGEGITSATVTATIITPFFHGNRRIAAKQISTTTDSTGYWELSLIETASVSRTIVVDIQANTDDGTSKRQQYTITVPDQISASFSDLV